MPREGLGAGLRPKGHSQPVVTTCHGSLGSYGPPHMAALTMVPCFQGVLGQPLAPQTVPPELGDRAKQRDPEWQLDPIEDLVKDLPFTGFPGLDQGPQDRLPQAPCAGLPPPPLDFLTHPKWGLGSQGGAPGELTLFVEAACPQSIPQPGQISPGAPEFWNSFPDSGDMEATGPKVPQGSQGFCGTP